jgi:hypothetical protein
MEQRNAELYDEIHDLVDTINTAFPGVSSMEVVHRVIDDERHSIDFMGKIVIRALALMPFERRCEQNIVVVKFYSLSPVKVYKVQNPYPVAVDIDAMVVVICSWLKHANPRLKRTCERCAVFKEELLSVVWHPDNVFRLGLVVGF